MSFLKSFITLLFFITLVAGIGTSAQPMPAARAQGLDDRDSDGIEDQMDPCPDDFDTTCTTPDSAGAQLPAFNGSMDQGQRRDHQLGGQMSETPAGTLGSTSKETSQSAGNTTAQLSSKCSPNGPTLKLKSKGPYVVLLQNILLRQGYDLGKKGADGDYGPSTRAAVINFQKTNGLHIDGAVGRETWPVLCNLVTSVRPVASSDHWPPDATARELYFARTSFIVQLKSEQTNTLNEIIESLKPHIASARGSLIGVYDTFGMFSLKFETLQITDQFRNRLNGHPAIQHIYDNDIAALDQSAAEQIVPNNINRVDGDLSTTVSGDNKGSVDADIAVIDSGVYSAHPDLNVRWCVSFIPRPQKDISELPCHDDIDREGSHGTVVAGIAAAEDNTEGVVGTAPGARIWALIVSDGEGRHAYYSQLLAALNWANKHTDEIEVVNLSIGDRINPEYKKQTTALENAVKKLVRAGVVVVKSAGNANDDVANWEIARGGELPGLIVVSAITDTDGKCGGEGTQISGFRFPGGISHQPYGGMTVINNDDMFASYSNYGKAVDLAASGGPVVSTVSLSYKTTSAYIEVGKDTPAVGTSFAAPAVAGAAALMKTRFPSYSPAEIEARLKIEGVTHLDDECDKRGWGYFKDNYPAEDGVKHTHQEPLLYMGPYGIYSVVPEPGKTK